MALFNEAKVQQPKKEVDVPQTKKSKANQSNGKSKVIRFTEKKESEKEKLKLVTKKKPKKKNSKKAKGEKEKKEKRKQARKSIADILPLVDVTEAGFFELKEGKGFFDIYQVQSKDVYSMNEEETKFDIYNMANFHQSYQYDTKVVALNFPVSTVKQQEFIMKKIEECKSSLYEKFLIRKLKELQYLEWGRTNREYFIFIYGPTEKELTERVETVVRLHRRTAPVQPIDMEKKNEILFKLYNQNTKIGSKKQ